MLPDSQLFCIDVCEGSDSEYMGFESTLRGVEWGGVEWSGVESGVEWTGVEWSGMEWSGVE